MKKYKHTKLSFKVMVSSVGLLLIASSGSASAAASASMSMSPSTSSITQGSTVELTIQVKAGSQKISGAQACMRFNAEELTLINTDTSASPLTYATPSSSADCNAGDVQVSRFGVSYPSGTFTLAKLTLKALSPTASSTISFDNAKSYVKDNSTTDSKGTYISILSSTSGATIKQSAIPAGEASPNPASPEKNSVNSPALTDAKHSGQASSNDVKIGKNGNIEATYVNTTTTPSTRRTLVTIGAAILTLLIASVLLAKFVGLPGQTTPKKSKKASSKE